MQQNEYIRKILDDYLIYFPKEKYRYSILEKQLANNENIGTRKNFNGHLTASITIFDEKLEKIFLIENINLGLLLNPGGHREQGDNEMYNTALREGKEETGLDIKLLSWHEENNFIPIDIDTHSIPANLRKQEEKHYHHDFRYVGIVNLIDENNIKLQKKEVSGGKRVELSPSYEILGFSGNTTLQKIKKNILG